MRISTAQYYSFTSDHLQRLQSQLNTTQEQISTNSKILHYSDNPIDSASIAQLEQHAARLDQYKKNIQVATNQNEQVSLVLDNVTQLLVRVKELGSQANSAAVSDTSKTQITNELSGLLDQLQGLLNSKDVNGHYLFSGFNESQKPFLTDAEAGIEPTVTDPKAADPKATDPEAAPPKDDSTTAPPRDNDIAPPAGKITVNANYQYSGNQGQKQIQLDDNYWIPGVSSGYDLFENITSIQGSTSVKRGVLSTVDQLSQNITDGSSTDISNDLIHLDKVIEHITNATSTVGARLQQLDNAVSFQDALATSTQQWLSKLKDVDISTAATQLNIQSLALQATQASFAKISGLSLFNFL